MFRLMLNLQWLLTGAALCSQLPPVVPSFFRRAADHFDVFPDENGGSGEDAFLEEAYEDAQSSGFFEDSVE